MGLRAYGVAVLVAAASLWAMSGTQREKPVLAATTPDAVRVLELDAAMQPDSVDATRALAQAYLDARQPGLAIVLVEGSKPAVHDDVRVQHVYARALVDGGRNEEALAIEAGVVAACHPVAEAAPARPGCDAVLLATAMRRTDILRELVSLGVEDAQAHPEMSLVAYQNATREARVMVQ
ncbi:MAG TPA: hypothetical protein VGL81_15305 [Polyangiaceae bacterium]|jgi:hypothetical protein